MSYFQFGLSAKLAHTHLRESLQILHHAEKNAVLWFDEIRRRRLYRELGYSNIQAYAITELGFSKARCSQFIRLTESLEKLPKLRAAVARGELAWTKVREVVKVASADNEERWVEEARNSSRRELEAKVKTCRERAKSKRRRDPAQALLLDGVGAAAGKVGARAAGPSAVKQVMKGDAGAAETVANESVFSSGGESTSTRVNDLTCEAPISLSLRFTPEQFARYEALVEQLRKLRKPAGLPTSNLPASREELLLAGLSAFLDSISMKQEDAGHAPCRNSAGKMPDPDYENPVKISATEATTNPFTRVNASTLERVNKGSCPAAAAGVAIPAAPGPTFQIVVHKCGDCGRASVVSGRGDLALNTATMSRVECDSQTLSPGKHNKSSISPGLRRRVLARDGHRCQAPGCASTRFLEVHHIQPRAAGGGNEPENLVTLCASCHQLLHEMSEAGRGTSAWVGKRLL